MYNNLWIKKQPALFVPKSRFRQKLQAAFCTTAYNHSFSP
ncbi:hypothetical protein HMPREF0476_1929 [Kingella kingae ATCC 23330]|uniref:Uncharacterized protein n=1 Tax=Kingella kingae ATCC 23330 TaxID=887327 RepID=F5S9P6_KINKI|nr:hypothetical protein HMPREF0476_1929 [Kingella kingae ATCC 23330]